MYVFVYSYAFFFFKQKTAYEMRISDWSSDVCSSDLIAGIQQEKAQAFGIARRLYTRLLYGADHPYANPTSGSGTETSVASMQVADLQAFYQRWLRPDSATLLIVGDTTMAEIEPLLEKQFGDWKAPAAALPTKMLATVALPSAPRLVLVNKRSEEPSLIKIGRASCRERGCQYV